MSKVSELNKKLTELSTLDYERNQLNESKYSLSRKKMCFEKYQEELGILISFLVENHIFYAQFEMKENMNISVSLNHSSRCFLNICIYKKNKSNANNINITIDCEGHFEGKNYYTCKEFCLTDNTSLFVEEYIEVFKYLMNNLDVFKSNILKYYENEILKMNEDYKLMIQQKEKVLDNLNELLTLAKKFEGRD